MKPYPAIYIGIDPGKSGGVAFIDSDGKAWAGKMPTDPYRLDLLMREVRAKGDECYAYLEAVHATPQMGVCSSFNFGKGFGALEQCLSCLRIPYDLVSPQRWQKDMDCLTGGDKNVTKRKAQELYPELKITHAIADALLIATYCYRERA